MGYGLSLRVRVMALNPSDSFNLFVRYGSVIPHPMIVSQVWALLGFLKAQHFRANAAPYALVHIVLYAIHLLQEVFNVHQPDRSKNKSSKLE